MEHAWGPPDFITTSVQASSEKWVHAQLEHIQNMILAAHTAKAAGSLQEAYHGFFSLGEEFVLNSLHASAQTYYRECFELAKKAGWSDGQLNANLNIGDDSWKWETCTKVSSLMGTLASPCLVI